MLFYYHCRIVNGVEDITDFFICIIIIDRVYMQFQNSQFYASEVSTESGYIIDYK